MIALSSVVRKGRAVILKGPSTLRNIAYSSLGIWPVGHLTNERLRKMPTYCISLRRATQRRQIMQSQAKSMGLENFHIVDAVDARELTMERAKSEGLYDDASSTRLHGRSLSLAEIAGSLSHGLIYERLTKEKTPWALVVEDDALFLTRRLNAFNFEDVPDDAEMVFLNSFTDRGTPRDRVRNSVYGVDSWTGSAAAYLLSSSGAVKLASAYRPVTGAADSLLGRVMPAPGDQSHEFKQVGVSTQLITYMVHPDCVLNGSVCYYYTSYLAGKKSDSAR